MKLVKYYVRSSQNLEEDVFEYLENNRPRSGSFNRRLAGDIVDLYHAADEGSVDLPDFPEFAEWYLNGAGQKLSRNDLVFMLSRGINVVDYSPRQLNTLRLLIERGQDVSDVADPNMSAAAMKRSFHDPKSEDFQEALLLLKQNLQTLKRSGTLFYDKMSSGSKCIYLWYIKDSVSLSDVRDQKNIIQQLPQCSAVFEEDNGYVRNHDAYIFRIGPKVTDDTSLGSVDTSPRSRSVTDMYEIKYTEFTGSWDSRSGVTTKILRKRFSSDLECFQYILDELTDYHYWVDEEGEDPINTGNLDAIIRYIDGINENDEESVKSLILYVKKDGKTIYSID